MNSYVKDSFENTVKWYDTDKVESLETLTVIRDFLILQEKHSQEKEYAKVMREYLDVKVKRLTEENRVIEEKKRRTEEKK